MTMAISLSCMFHANLSLWLKGKKERKPICVALIMSYSSIGTHVLHMLVMEHTVLSATHLFIHVFKGPIWALGCKNRPDLFPGRMLYEVTRAGLGFFMFILCCRIVLFIDAACVVLGLASLVPS